MSSTMMIAESNFWHITIVNIISGLIAVVGLYFFYRRNSYMSKQTGLQYEQIELQIRQRTDERFNAGVNLLGSPETSARTGAVYSLYQLALDDTENKYRKQIAQIICSHIRSKTQEAEYQKQHKKRPSNEIQTCIDLLFKGNGLYQQDFAKQDLSRANFSYSFLVGADFKNAQCHGANFSHTQCQGVNFWFAQCQAADFTVAQCQGADFRAAQCQGADFMAAECQNVYFIETQCQGANFYHTQCQGAIFRDTQCQGAYSSGLCDLQSRIGKESDLSNMIIAGEMNQETIESIELVKKFLNANWYSNITTIITHNKGEKVECGQPIDGIITGKLKDSEYIQTIIAKDWEKLRKITSSKNN